jgi:hypothetical protein
VTSQPLLQELGAFPAIEQIEPVIANGVLDFWKRRSPWDLGLYDETRIAMSATAQTDPLNRA